MKINQRNVSMGFAAGLVLGAVVLTSFGQNEGKAKPGASGKTKATTKTSSAQSYTPPRYSVQYDSSQRLLLITDNAYNQLYLYNTTGTGGSTLRSRIDLRQTGARKLPAVTYRSPATTTPKAKGARPKSSGKPAPKKKSPKKTG